MLSYSKMIIKANAEQLEILKQGVEVWNEWRSSDPSKLVRASLTESTVQGAILTGYNIYGLSAWDLIGTPADQKSLTITNGNQAIITVDELEMAQFIYLLLNNNKVRNAIDSIVSKVVLILGRFTPDRKSILDSIRDKLRLMNLTPVLFDFDKPESKHLTGTISTMANLAIFVIIDLTEPNSVHMRLPLLLKIYELRQYFQSFKKVMLFIQCLPKINVLIPGCFLPTFTKYRGVDAPIVEIDS